MPEREGDVKRRDGSGVLGRMRVRAGLNRSRAVRVGVQDFGTANAQGMESRAR